MLINRNGEYIMTKEMLDTLVYALSAPSLVDILLLLVTTAYFIATVFVYRANKKMAKAAEDQIKTATQMAELSRNIDMYDKRFAKIKFLIDNTFWIVCRRLDFIIELKLLFPSENIHSILAELIASYNEAKEVDDDYDLYRRLTLSPTMNIEYLQQQIEKTLEKNDRDDIVQIRNFAERFIAIYQKDGEEARRLNLFDILESRKVKEIESSGIQERLVNALIADVEQSIAANNIEATRK